MKKAFLLLIFVFGTISYSNVFANETNEFENNEENLSGYLITYENLNSKNEEEIIEIGGKVNENYKHFPIISASLPASAINELKKNKNILSIKTYKYNKKV